MAGALVELGQRKSRERLERPIKASRDAVVRSVKDPEHGETPYESGASAAAGNQGASIPGSGKAKRRRRKASRSSSAHASSPDANPQGPSVSGAGQSGHPVLDGEPVRKRKRRRRTKSASSGSAQGQALLRSDGVAHGHGSRASGADAHDRGAETPSAHTHAAQARDPREGNSHRGSAVEGSRHAPARRSSERGEEAGGPRSTGHSTGVAGRDADGGSATQAASDGNGSKPSQGRGPEPGGKGRRNHKHRHRGSAQARPLQGTDVVRSARDRVGATGTDGRAPAGQQRQGRGPGAQGGAGAAVHPDAQGVGSQAGAAGRPATQQSGHSGHQRFEQGSNPGGARGGPHMGGPSNKTSGHAGHGRSANGAGQGPHPGHDGGRRGSGTPGRHDPNGAGGDGYSDRSSQNRHNGGEGGYAARTGSGFNAGHHAAGGSRHADVFESDEFGPPPLYAALDLGTNNCRLLIAQPTRPGQFRVVDGFSRIVRLGEGLAASGRLSEDAMNRSVEALKICAAKLGHRNIRRSRLIATEAARAAENGVIFMDRVSAETGLELEIIDRETEARLAVSGCASLVGREARSVVLFDIGGGSSEIAVLHIGDNRSSRLANHITHWTSLPVGVVTLSERHGGRDVTPESFEGMIREVSGMLDRFDCPDIEAVRAADDFHLIGTSGTVTTLAGVHLDLPRYDRRRVDGLWLSDDEVSAMQARLLSWDFAARAANPCIGPDRADLVLAGCAILEAIRRRWPSTRMRVADRGLREGLLTDMMADDGVWRRGRGRRLSRPGSQTGSEEGRSS